MNHALCNDALSPTVNFIRKDKPGKILQIATQYESTRTAWWMSKRLQQTKAMSGVMNYSLLTSKASWVYAERRQKNILCQVVSSPPGVSKSRGPASFSRILR